MGTKTGRMVVASAVMAGATAGLFATSWLGCTESSDPGITPPNDGVDEGEAMDPLKLTGHKLGAVEKHALATIAKGRNIFRYDTFGDEDFWGGQLKLHQAIAG